MLIIMNFCHNSLVSKSIMWVHKIKKFTYLVSNYPISFPEIFDYLVLNFVGIVFELVSQDPS